MHDQNRQQKPHYFIDQKSVFISRVHGGSGWHLSIPTLIITLSKYMLLQYVGCSLSYLSSASWLLSFRFDFSEQRYTVALVFKIRK